MIPQPSDSLAVNLKVRISREMEARLLELKVREDRSVGWLVRKAISDMLSTKKEG